MKAKQSKAQFTIEFKQEAFVWLNQVSQRCKWHPH
ncbi:hypothetical protein GALL_130280 [mine drainage metagenome]|uniref:Uncharacterized protein n=1 Tax=mine drainage metagenome TaxID=410659 RepID=A0A1J5S9S8_9ZZZZ